MTLVQKVFSALIVLALVACAHTMAAKRVNVTLSGAEEVPPVSTAARGSGSFTIGDDGAVSGSVTTTGVKGTMAHIHIAPRGQNGPVIVPLTKSGDTYTAAAGAKLNDAQMAAFRAGNLYVNVHSDANKGGEVRGQLNP
jgi:CHRD domain-containing protein